MTTTATFPYIQDNSEFLTTSRQMAMAERSNARMFSAWHYRDVRTVLGTPRMGSVIIYDILPTAGLWATSFDLQRCEAIQSMKWASKEIECRTAGVVLGRDYYVSMYLPSYAMSGMPISEQEAVIADTNRAMSLEFAVKALNAISVPTQIEEVDVSFDPDDIPLV